MTFAKRNPHELAGLIVSIIAVCPRCSARYELESDYLGKRIRCQDPQCRFVFEVADSAEPARPATSGRRAPTLDDETEPTELEWEAPQSRGEDQPIEADWRSLPPPPVRLGVPQPEEPAVSGRAADEGTASAEEVLQLMGLAPGGGQGAAGDEEIPEVEVLTPISEGEPEPVELEEVEETEPTDYAELYAKLQRKPRRRLLLIAIPVMLVIGAVAGAGTLLLVKKRQEAAINQRAEQVYAELTAKQYRRAAEAAKDVAGKHKEAGKFRFLRDFATAMEAATDPTIPTDKRRKDFVDYLIAVRDSNDPYKDLIQEYRSHVRDAFLRIHDDEIREATRRADTQDFDTAVRLQTEAQKTQALIREYSGADESLPRDLSDRYTALVQKIEAGRKYLKFLEESQNALKTVTPGALAQVKEQAKNQGFLNRPEIVELINRSEKALLSMIVFTSEERSAEAFPIDRHPSLILGSNTDPVPANTGIVFAVARGVLYALAEGKGQIIWAARVGIDTVHLPVRVPASGNVPALVLVTAPDRHGLVAREAATGKVRWYQRLPGPVCGQPLLVEGRLIVALSDPLGTIVVLESRDGSQLGYMRLNQPIAVGPSLQPGTTRVFVAADAQNVFVLDANPPVSDGPVTLLKLLSVLATGHGAGSLRSEPVVVGGVDEATGQVVGTAYLILAQSDGLQEMRLRSFIITAQPDGAISLAPSVEQKVPGWSWFPPVCNQETVTAVTDSGALIVMGINQKDNQDETLFPLIVEKPKDQAAPLGRGQVVHADEQSIWYLANGEMNCRLRGFKPKEGPTTASGWKQPLRLGTPLHASQVSADGSTLYVVTQTEAPPSWRMTAVNAAAGTIVWQRELGTSFLGEPFRLGEYVYQVDRGAGVVAVDPKQLALSPNQEWAFIGQPVTTSRSDVVGEPYVLPHPNGRVALLLFTTGDGKQLQAQVLEPGRPASDPWTVALPAPLAGAPVLTEKSVILPLTDGGLHRWEIGQKDLKRGPDWRGPRLGETVRTFLARAGKDDILATDGARGLTLYAWPDGDDAQLKQQTNLTDRVLLRPMLVAHGEKGHSWAVVEAGGRVSLLDGETLAVSQRWDTRGLRKGNEITAGPFIVTDQGQPRILVVVDQVQVVCLAPNDRREVWSYRGKGEGLAVAPRQVGEAIVLADVSGRFEAVAVSDGRPLAPPFPPNTPLLAAPAATPLDLGDKLFAPLTDGTVIFIPRGALGLP